MLISQKELILHGIDLEIDKLEKGLVQLGHEVEGYVEYRNENLLIGLTTECIKHPEADKLNIVTVDIGTKELTIVCGAPNVGKDQYVIVAVEGCKLGDIEIKNTKLRGIESQGMLCSLAEIGLEDKSLTEDDKNGIFNFDSKQELGSNALVALGLEDIILDVSLTANRGDCLSYVGVLRDLSAFLNTKLKIVSFTPRATIENSCIPKINDENSKQLSTLLIKDVKVTNTPEWLKIWLAKHEIKSQNNIVDLANYVMLELGLPIHTYDADMIYGNISSNVVDATLEGTQFVALDGNKYELARDSIIIKDDKKIISLASVMGSDSTKITNDTTNVLMEIGVFDPVLVRKTAAKVLSKKTDASIRGEKNVDFNQVDNAYSL
ncbi:MAG: phenylalanine--tRNA ligase beta subunit-related protein, partial [Mycoplasmatales bacterium]